LKAETTYYFRIKSLRTPSDVAKREARQPVTIEDGPISFTTLTADPAPKTYYVSADGNDGNTGLSRDRAWRTIQRAANSVGPGDTVLVAGGRYSEKVRMRATGEAGAPIAFTCIPGEKVVMDGAGKALNGFFTAAGKSHLRFDGFYFVLSNREPLQGWLYLRVGGEFNLYRCRDVEISRCFSDGRTGYTAHFVTAHHVEGMTIRNCVVINKMTGALYLARCPGLRVENCVIARPMIMSFVLRNAEDETAVMDNNILTDMMRKKAVLNIALLCVDGRKEAFRMHNNCYFLRSFPPETRVLMGKSSVAADLAEHIMDPLFADPMFAGAVALAGDMEEPPEFSVELLLNPRLPIDFDSFFATNREVIERGIGLQPEAFNDFLFERDEPPAQ